MVNSVYYTPIVLSFTPNYYIAAATCIHSILVHSTQNDLFHFYCLLKEDLPDDLKQSLANLIKGKGEISFSVVDKAYFKGVIINERFTEAAYYRLLLSEILLDIDKVLYLDCDIIIRNNLSALFKSTDVSDYYIAAVKEVPLSSQIDYFVSLGCDPNAYINSGVLLMNLKKIRKDNIKDKFIYTIQNGSFAFPDQDTINIVCKGKIKFLKPFHNSIRTFYIKKYKERFLKIYNESELNAVLEHGSVHFTNKVKPWNNYAINFEIWWDYYMQLPKEIKAKGTVNRKMYLLYKICKTRLGKVFLNFILKFKRKLLNNKSID